MSSRSRFHIEAMDCPSEEAMIRMALQDCPDIHTIEADFSHRMVDIIHDKTIEDIMSKLEPLGFGTKHVETVIHKDEIRQSTHQAAALRKVLVINAGLFGIESLAGYLSGSLGLFADSLDMLADACVYGLSLLVISGSRNLKTRIATLSGYLQLGLGIFGFMECIKRTIYETGTPDYATMILVSMLAMGGNLYSMHILRRQQSDEPHMQASMIFTSTDILVNAGVIIAGICTLLFDSMIPDLIIGCIVFGFILKGSFRIMQLR